MFYIEASGTSSSFFNVVYLDLLSPSRAKYLLPFAFMSQHICHWFPIITFCAVVSVVKTICEKAQKTLSSPSITFRYSILSKKKKTKKKNSDTLSWQFVTNWILLSPHWRLDLEVDLQASFFLLRTFPYESRSINLYKIATSTVKSSTVHWCLVLFMT